MDGTDYINASWIPGYSGNGAATAAADEKEEGVIPLSPFSTAKEMWKIPVVILNFLIKHKWKCPKTNWKKLKEFSC